MTKREITYDVDKETERTVYLHVVFPYNKKTEFDKMFQTLLKDKKRRTRNVRIIELYFKEKELENEMTPLLKRNYNWFKKGIKTIPQ